MQKGAELDPTDYTAWCSPLF